MAGLILDFVGHQEQLVLSVFPDFYCVYRSQQVTVRSQNVPWSDDFNIRVRLAELFHSFIVFLEGIHLVLGGAFLLFGFLFSYPEYYHACITSIIVGSSTGLVSFYRCGYSAEGW
jgi:hypothetical protein